MSVKTKAELRTYADANRNTNGTQSLVGATENIMWNDVIDSMAMLTDISSESMNWKGVWVDGEYIQYDVVRDDGWLMIAKTTTSDRPAPQSTGELQYSVPTDTTFNIANGGGVIVKAIHNFTMKQSGWMKALQLYVPESSIDSVFRVTFINVTANTATVVNGLILNPNEWNTIKADSVIYKVGDEFEVWFEQYNSSVADAIDGNWDSNLGTGAPANESFNINSLATPTVLTIDNEDLGSVDRSSELNAVAAGSIIHIAEAGDMARSVEVEVTTTTVYAGYTSYAVSLIGLGTKGSIRDNNECIININNPISLDTKYSLSPTEYTTQPDFVDVVTSLEYNGVEVISPITDAYGINVIFQQATVSDDWDLLASSESSGGGTSPHASDFAAIGGSIDTTGDDKGMKIEDGQFSVGSPATPHEAVFGSGDSYPVDTAYAVTEAETSNLVITGATDITEILQSDSGSSVNMFGDGTALNYLLIGSDYQFGGIKLKTVTAGVTSQDDVLTYYLIDDKPSWIETWFMATDSGFPYTQYGNILANNDNASEQVRFGVGENNYVRLWEKVTLNINGVDVEKYWAKIEATRSFTTQPVIEQVKQHTDRFEINAEGVTEYFGRSRFARRISFHKYTNANKNPTNENISVAAGITVVSTDDEFVNGAADGNILVGKLPDGIDTSLNLELDIEWYPKDNTVGDVELEIEAVHIINGFVYDGTATTEPIVADTTSVDTDLETRQISSFSLPIYDMLVGNTLVLSLFRDATSGNINDTYTNNIVITGIYVNGIFWR